MTPIASHSTFNTYSNTSHTCHRIADRSISPRNNSSRCFLYGRECQTLAEEISFPLCGFRSYFTPTSGCFSSFPQGTCSLSVSPTVFSLSGCASAIFGIHFQVYLLSSKESDVLIILLRGYHPVAQVPSRTFARFKYVFSPCHSPTSHYI